MRVLDRGFDPRSGLGQTEENKFGICCFSSNHAQHQGVRANTGCLLISSSSVDAMI